MKQIYTVEGEIALRQGLSLLPRSLDTSQYNFVLDPFVFGRVITSVISPDGQWIATSTEEGKVQIRSAVTDTEITYIPYATEISDMTFSPNGEWLAIAERGSVSFWERRRGHKLGQITQDGQIHQIAFSPEGRRLAIAGWGIAAQVWETSNGGSEWREIARMGYIDTFPEEMVAIVFGPDGHWLATQQRSGTIQVWDIDTTPQVAKVVQPLPVCWVLFSPDNQWLVSRSENYSVTHILNTATFQEISESQDDILVYNHDSSSSSCYRWPVPIGQDAAFSPDSHWLAVASRNYTVSLWDLSLRQKIAFLSHKGQINQVTFSSDGQWLATASEDGTAVIWQVPTGEELARLDHGTFIDEAGIEHIRPVNTIAISPDQQWVATGSYNLIRLWNTSTWERVFEFEYTPLATDLITYQ
jgi:WD40 repeat protein